MAEHSQKIVEELNASGNLPYEVVWKPTLITNELIRRTFNEANTDDTCAGVITWMHTFSPAKSWILGLQEFRKPLLHLHTQFNREIPYDTIDMDFMNENQAAHGDREYGHIFSRLGMERKVVMGYWADADVQKRIGAWMRTAVGVIESSHVRVMRIADNMRNVAVTEGDKVEAQIKFGWEVDTYPVNEIAEAVAAISQADIDTLVEEYYDKYEILPEGREGVLEAHMLEVCPTIATSLIDLGDRFRLIINDVNCKKTEKPMPKLPVATAFWTPEPNLQTGAEAWILAGGAHHTAFSYDLTAEQMGDWAAYMGIEAVFIDRDTTIRRFQNELKWNALVYRK